MLTDTRTPLPTPPSVERSRTGAASSCVRAPFIWPDRIPEPRNHGDEIRTLRAMQESGVLDDYLRVPGAGWYRIEADAATVYPCISERSGVGNLWLPVNDEADFDAGLARFCGYAFAALAVTGAALIAWRIFG